MTLPESTYEVLYMRSCNLPYNEKWVNWSQDMITEGYDAVSSDLLMLSAERAPLNEFEIKDMVDKILSELSLDTQDKEIVIRNYIMFLRSKVLEGEMEILTALKEIQEIYFDLDLNTSLNDFYLLYCAKGDLQNETVQWYWDGANRSNIDRIVLEYFENWQSHMFKLKEGTSHNSG